MNRTKSLYWLLCVLIILAPAGLNAQQAITHGGKKPQTNQQKPKESGSASNVGKLEAPSAPTPISEKNRTIKDLLYFPYGCLSNSVNNKDKAKEELKTKFGSYEVINNLDIGLHRNSRFDFSYKGVPIGVIYVDWYYNQHWYLFYFNTITDANNFYSIITKDIINAGIPLKKDKVYGGLSNRKNPVSIFKWVYVSPAEIIKEADGTNINKPEAVGKYCVELGVYKR